MTAQKNALFFDYDTTVVNVLNQRISEMNIMTAHAYVADYNQPDTICSILRQRCSHDKSLNLGLTEGQQILIIYIIPA